MLDRAKRGMMKRAVQQVTPSETPVGVALANLIATIEARQMTAVSRLVDAADVDEAAVGYLDADAREQKLLDLADDRLEAWWLDEVAADHLNQPEKAEEYVGMDREAWADQIATWGDSYRQALPDRVDGMTDAQIANLHVRETFGVTLGEFAREVVDWSRGRVVEDVLAGHLRSTESAIHRVAAELED